MKPSDMKNSWIILHFLLLACLMTQLIAASTGWQQDAQLTASNGNANDQFAYSVSVSDNIAVIGAPKHSSGGLLRSGAAYIFRPGFNFDANIALIWPPTETEVLTASDKGAEDEFGLSVSVFGNTVLIGSPLHNTSAIANSGKAYIFRSNDGGINWSETQKLIASDVATGASFGYSVYVTGNVALIGAPFLSSNTGAAYHFQSSNQGATWTQRQKLTASAGTALDQFGASVSVFGKTALIGADFRSSKRGAAYIFDATPPFSSSPESSSTSDDDDGMFASAS